MKKNLIILIFLFPLSSCNNSSSEKEITKNPTITKKENANYELSDKLEKIALLSAINQINYDTTYTILQDYYMETLDIGMDSIKFYLEKSVNTISHKYNISKPKVASIIFSFKYEVLTKEEIINDFIENEHQNDEHEEYDPRY